MVGAVLCVTAVYTEYKTAAEWHLIFYVTKMQFRSPLKWSGGEELVYMVKTSVNRTASGLRKSGWWPQHSCPLKISDREHRTGFDGL